MPESSFISLRDVAVEYRLYLPSAGFIAAAVLFIAPVMQRRHAVPVLVCILMMFGLLTYARNPVWKDGYSLWSDTVQKSPSSARAHSNYAYALMGRGNLDEAEAELKEALALDPKDPQRDRTIAKLGHVYLMRGDYAAAEEEFARALSMNPSLGYASNGLGETYYRTGRYTEAESALSRAVQLEPGDYRSHMLLGKVYGSEGRFDKGLPEMSKAVEIAPADFVARYNFAVLYELSGRLDEARRQAETARGLARTPEAESAANNLIKRIDDRGSGAGGMLLERIENREKGIITGPDGDG